MVAAQEVASKTANNERKYRSPNRILARSFRMARDKWKQKYMNARADLKRARQLATERGDSRDRWHAECEAAKEQTRAAETLAQERIQELEQLRACELDVKKKLITDAS
jgi:hypothetical protein